MNATAKPWYKSATVIALAVAIITKIFLLGGEQESEAAKAAADIAPGLLSILGILCDALAVWGRARAKGPVTMTSASAAAVNQQSGFIRVSLMVLLACCAFALMSLPACTGTRAAYQEASSHKQTALQDTAFVVVSHYSAIVHEARLLKEQGALVGEPLRLVQEAVQTANPYIVSLSTAVDKYRAIQDAQTQEALQRAVDEAVIALADVVRKLNEAKAPH